MRSCLITWLFIITAGNFCRAQDTVKMEIPQLLESGRIDSLMLSIIKSPENLKAAKNDSCLLLSLNINEFYCYVHGIQALNNRETIFGTGNFEMKDNVGYFEVGGYLVFVYGDELMKKFFANTHQTKEFVFIKPTAQQNIFLVLNYLNLGLTYKEGIFGFKAR